ncbi:MAG: SCO family protein [candidate division WOR-3 bacterium]
MIIFIAEFSTYVPNDIKGVGVDFKGGVKVDDVFLTDQNGRRFNIAEIFDGKRPVLIVPMYYDCPVVCSTVLLKTYEALTKIKDLKPGRDYRVLVYSFNHRNTVKDASEKFKTYEFFFKDAAIFSVGDSLNILKLSQKLGYKYKMLKNGLYSHPVAIFTLTPDGKTSGVIYDLGEINPMDVRLSLLEASKGNIGENKLVNQFLLYCFEYDSANKRYEVVVWRLVKLVGVLSILMILAVYGYIFLIRK